MGTGPLFELERVTVERRGVRALDTVDLVVPEGLSVIVGPSGSGKSTLLRLCNRLEVPTSGTVRHRGRDVAGLDPLGLRRRVAMVFQRPTPFPGTVRDNLLAARPDAPDDTLVDVLGEVGLGAGPFLDRIADELSGGEGQRLCLARSLLVDPEVLLLDEATSSLDPASTRALEQLVVRLVARGLSAVWVTHDLAQARRLGVEPIVLGAGRVADPSTRARYLADGRGDATDGPGDEARTP